ncbi:hypothetical protein [Chitinophaga varians]|uniref:hypothetical protein n=1 Tax=Chitinophaga varians TaxID=2202339 RepID=UPI00165FC067|nr:hypothetical protein [Chitinophaga varians]MBC9909734.1 hypothetical protein [Chitinophaga varians]
MVNLFVHPDITFTHLSNAEFAALKGKMVFDTFTPPPSLPAFGERIQIGTTSDNQRCFLFEYHRHQKPVVSFLILSAGSSVFYQYSDMASPQSVLSLVRGNITKFCLQEQGHFCLHASAICIDDQVVLFIGTKGAGKSTLATYFHLRGHAIWCDDYSLLHQKDHSFFAAQGETSLKINPDVAAALSIPQAQLQRVFDLPEDWTATPEADALTQKYYFKQVTSQTAGLPMKVAAVFFVNQRMPSPPNLITGIAGKDALSVLMHEMLLPGVNAKEYLRIYFQSAMTLLETVPSYNIFAPDDIRRIHEVYDSIIETISISRHV